MPELRRWYTIQYLCGHVSSLSLGTVPDTHDERVCPRCHRSVPIVWTSADLRMVCLGCPVRQSFGQSYWTLNEFVGRHMRKFPTHSVRVCQGNLIVEVRPASVIVSQQLSLDDVPPF